MRKEVKLHPSVGCWSLLFLLWSGIEAAHLCIHFDTFNVRTDCVYQRLTNSFFVCFLRFDLKSFNTHTQRKQTNCGIIEGLKRLDWSSFLVYVQFFVYLVKKTTNGKNTHLVSFSHCFNWNA